MCVCTFIRLTYHTDENTMNNEKSEFDPLIHIIVEYMWPVCFKLYTCLFLYI